MRKIFSTFLSFCLLISLLACGKSDSALTAEKAKSEIIGVSIKVSDPQLLIDAKEQLELQHEAFYQNTYDELVCMMLDTLVLAEKMCNDTVDVWHNSIWKIENEETNPYTKDGAGKFYEDFNDALYAYENSTRFRDYASQIHENDAYIKENNAIIKNPPEKFKGNMLDAYVNYYIEYQEFIQFALNYNESYNSFVEKFAKIEETSIDAYRKAAFYMSIK